MRTQLGVNARCVKNEQKLFANKSYLQTKFVHYQLVNSKSCHTESLLVWVVSARMTHGAGADDAVSSKLSNKTSVEVIFQFHVVQVNSWRCCFCCFYQFSGIMLLMFFFFAVFIFFNLRSAA